MPPRFRVFIDCLGSSTHAGLRSISTASEDDCLRACCRVFRVSTCGLKTRQDVDVAALGRRWFGLCSRRSAQTGLTRAGPIVDDGFAQ